MIGFTMLKARLNRQNCCLGIGLIALVLVLIAAYALFPAEPTFEGKTLSYWLDCLPSIDNGPDGRSESINLPASGSTPAELNQILKNAATARRALDVLGTNHLSIIIQRLQSRDSYFSTVMWRWAERLRLTDDAFFHSAKFRQGQAKQAFLHLGGKARAAVPQLLELTTNSHPNTQLAAWAALEVVAPDEFHQRKHPPIIEHAPVPR